MATKRNIHNTLNYSLMISIFLITYSSCLTLTPTKSTNTSVLDIDGNQLQSNIKYNIFPLSHAHGGLALSIRDPRHPCPPNVMQENDPTSVGLSLRILPRDQIISLCSDVNVAFIAATVCVQRTVWKVGPTDPITRRRYVASDGVLGSNLFKIDGYGGGYKIVYCGGNSTSSSVCGGPCVDVGVFVENGRRWLGLGGEPLVIVFKKVMV